MGVRSMKKVKWPIIRSKFNKLVNYIQPFIPKGYKEILSFLFSFFCLILAFGLIYFSSPNYQIKNIDVIITSPMNDDPVSSEFRVNGTIAKDLPEGYHLWIALKPESQSDWWPQGEGTVEPSNGFWHINAYINAQEDEKINISALIANEKINLKFLGWLDQGKYSGKYRGIKLPNDTIIKNSIEVKSLSKIR
jgi:hypothetical protein